MKRITIVLLITLIAVCGCTRIPASQETGVLPGEYDGLVSTEILKAENTNIKNELDKAKIELEDLKKEYISLSKNNNILTDKLIETEALLNTLKNDKLPVFKTEETDIINITKYLNEKKNIINNSYRAIEIVPLEVKDNIIIFYTKGYGNSFSQLYIWEAGVNEPFMVEGANFDKDGICEWLINDNYLIIETGYDDKYMIVDIIDKRIINTFETESNIYLIPGTSSILMQKTSLSSPVFVLYDFLINSEKELDINFKNKYTSFEISEDNIVFEGNYIDEYDIEYKINATIGIDKIIDLYEIMKYEDINNEENEINDSIDNESPSELDKNNQDNILDINETESVLINEEEQ